MAGSERHQTKVSIRQDRDTESRERERDDKRKRERGGRGRRSEDSNVICEGSEDRKERAVVGPLVDGRRGPRRLGGFVKGIVVEQRLLSPSESVGSAL